MFLTRMEGSPVDTHFACFSVESVGNHHPRQLLATVTPDEFETRIYVSPFVSPAKIGFSKAILLFAVSPGPAPPSRRPPPRRFHARRPRAARLQAERVQGKEERREEANRWGKVNFLHFVPGKTFCVRLFPSARVRAPKLQRLLLGGDGPELGGVHSAGSYAAKISKGQRCPYE